MAKLRVSEKARVAAKTMAVAYAAYMRASQEDDWNGIIVWGRMALDAQEALGLSLLDPLNVQRRMFHARRMEAKAA